MKFQEVPSEIPEILKARDFLGLFILLILWMTVGKILFEILINFLISMYDYSGGMSLDGKNNIVEIASALLTTITAACAQFLLILRMIPGKKLKSLLFYAGFLRVPKIYFLYALLISLGIIILHGPVLNTLFPPPEYFEPSEFLKIRMEGGFLSKIFLLPLAVIVAPVVEESLFRGVYFNSLKASFGSEISSVVCSVLFVFLHIETWLSGYWVSISALICLSIGLMYIRIKSGSILPAIMSHAGYNLVLVIAG